MNQNTFASYSNAYPTGHPFLLPASFTTTSATETAFLLSNGTQANLFVPTGTEKLGSQAPFDPNANSSKLGWKGRSSSWMGQTAPFFNSNSFNGRSFILRAFGTIFGGLTTQTLITASINVYVGASSVVTANTEIIAGANAGIGGGASNWMLEATMLWDATSQILNGTYTYNINNVTSATRITAATGLALTSLGFGATWTFATTSTSNAVGLVELSLEQR